MTSAIKQKRVFPRVVLSHSLAVSQDGWTAAFDIGVLRSVKHKSELCHKSDGIWFYDCKTIPAKLGSTEQRYEPRGGSGKRDPPSPFSDGTGPRFSMKSSCLMICHILSPLLSPSSSPFHTCASELHISISSFSHRQVSCLYFSISHGTLMLCEFSIIYIPSKSRLVQARAFQFSVIEYFI